MASEQDWKGLISARAEPVEIPEAAMILGDSPDGGSGAFLVLATDSRRWWLKPLNNAQGPRVTINEFVVGKMATLISAPACEVSLVRVPAALNGPNTRRPVVPGVACGSLDVSKAVNVHSLTMRERDYNRLRHVGVIALYDWCFGADDQWLYAGDEDMQIYSHDHGHYLTSHHWKRETLKARVATPCRPAAFDPTDLDRGEIDRLVGRLGSIHRDEIVGVLNQVPRSWPVEDRELETLGWFLEERAKATADRLRAL